MTQLFHRLGHGEFVDKTVIMSRSDLEILRNELCEELRELYDYELSCGNHIARIDRYAWELIDLNIVFSKPSFAEVRNCRFVIKETLLRYVNQDRHYPLETSFTAKEHRQAIAFPNR